MSANNTLKIFTPKEFKELDKKEIDKLIEEETPFTVSKIVNLENGFYWSFATDSIFDNNHIEIYLTKLEKKFLKLLIENIDQTVDYETIKNTVWKGKEMSVFTLRNFAKKIRDKTYYEIIINKSNHGYAICKKS